MLCDAEKSQLVIIDIQERLASAMPEKVMQNVNTNVGRLLQAANLMDVATISSEQYPKGLGATVEDIESLLPTSTRCVEKTCFACTGDSDFRHHLSLKRRPQVILCGIETHICVLQTAIELVKEGFEVFVVEDAVCSRNKQNHSNAIERLRQAGVIITNTESVMFEWLRDASHEHFKAISKLIR